MQRYLTAIFNDRASAEAAIRDLREAGLPAEEISIAAGRHHHRTLIARLGAADTPLVTDSNAVGQEQTRPVTEAGMKAGASLGAAVGLIAGIPLVLATGGGAGLLVAGAIAGLLGGGVTGAAAGGLAGALIGMGVPHRQAEDIQRRVHAGAIIVSLRADERHLDTIETFFSRYDLDEVIITALGGSVR